MNDMRSQIESLTAAEKADLLDQVWMSLEADSMSLTDAQKPELDRRIADYERNPSDLKSWEQVKQDLRKPR